MAPVAWDRALHGGGEPAFVPAWYPLLCAGFDLVFAAAIAWRMRSWRVMPAEPQDGHAATPTRVGGAASGSNGA